MGSLRGPCLCVCHLDLYLSPKEGASRSLCPSVEAHVLSLLGAQLCLLDKDEKPVCCCPSGRWVVAVTPHPCFWGCGSALPSAGDPGERPAASLVRAI